MLKTKTGKKVFLYTILCLIGMLCMFPFVWLLSSSLKPEARIFAVPPQLIPNPFTLKNYVDAVTLSPLLRWLGNTALITLVVVLGGSIVASMAGFAYAKLRFPGNSLLFLIPLCAMMIPNEVIIIPLFKIWGGVSLINTHVPLILPNIVGAGGMFGVFLFRQYYLSIPNELVEASRIDGCTPFGAYRSILLPMSQSPLATLAIFNFMYAWNDFLDPLVYLNSSEKYTLALGLQLFSDLTGVLWGQLMAACVVATLPLVIMFFIAQNKFIESVALAGMKS